MTLLDAITQFKEHFMLFEKDGQTVIGQNFGMDGDDLMVRYKGENFAIPATNIKLVLSDEEFNKLSATDPDVNVFCVSADKLNRVRNMEPFHFEILGKIINTGGRTPMEAVQNFNSYVTSNMGVSPMDSTQLVFGSYGQMRRVSPFPADKLDAVLDKYRDAFADHDFPPSLAKGGVFR